MKTGLKESLVNLKLFVMKSMNINSRNFQLILNILLIAIINIAAAAFSFRIDLTSKDVYSLSKRSRVTVSTLNERLKIKVFFSKDLPAEHAAVYRYLKDMLEEYGFYGNRNFSYEIIDEDKLEEQAKDYGINPVQSREFANDQVKLRSVYMGLVIQHADLVEKIESLTSTTGLEYEITSRIEKMTGKIDSLLKLEKPVTLTLYLDGRVLDLPIDGIGRLEEHLAGVVAKSNLRNYGKIKFQTVDPSAAGISDLDVKHGISKLKWNAMKSRNGRSIPAGEGYFGLVMEGNGKFARIDLDVAPTIMGTNVITGLKDLENTINNGVGVLLSSSPKIGYVTGHGIPDINDKKSPEGAGMFASALSDMYQLAAVDLKRSEIPDDIRVLVINGPTDMLTDIEKYRIDQFLMHGKSVIIFANSFTEIDAGGQQGFMGREPLILPVDSGLDELTSHYGVKIGKSIVLDKNCTKINLGQMLTDYPLIPMIDKGGLDRESVITKYINSALFIKASPLEVDEKLKEKGISSTLLVSTSPQSWLMEGRMNFNPFFMSAAEGKEMKSYPVAVLLSGKFESFFKGRDIPAESVTSGSRGQLSAVNKLDSTIASGKSELIVVGTSEINSSGFMSSARRILSGSSGEGAHSNEILVHSMVDYLAGNIYVPEMKSKSLDFNPLIKTDDRTRFLLKIINMVLVPLFTVLTGLVVWRRRISRKRQIEISFGGGAADEK